LTEPALTVAVTGPEPVNGVFREGRMPATTVSLFVERYNCIAGLNTNPFSPVSAKVGEERTIDGIAVSNGVLVSRPNPYFDALVFYDSDTAAAGRAAIVSQRELGDLSGVTNAVGGFQTVLREGAPVERVLNQAAAGKAPKHPRSAAGLSADGNTLYFLAVDGRRPGSAGVTEAELALMLKRLGAYDGLNFDGGGSTALVLRSLKAGGENPYGEARPVNTPIHKQIHGWERAVAICLGIRIEREKGD
jgi:exopolysaccharide biosynthesis protein